MPQEVKILCPFHCTLDECDENGYCECLVGFTNDGNTYEAIKMNPMYGRRFTDGQDVRPVLPTDILKRVGASSRVYRRQSDQTMLTLGDNDGGENSSIPEQSGPRHPARSV